MSSEYTKGRIISSFIPSALTCDKRTIAFNTTSKPDLSSIGFCFSSNTGVNIENLEVPSNCIDKGNINNLKWIEDNNVWVDNDDEQEIKDIIR